MFLLCSYRVNAREARYVPIGRHGWNGPTRVSAEGARGTISNVAGSFQVLRDRAEKERAGDKSANFPRTRSWKNSSRAARRGKPWLPIRQRRLSEIPRHVLRVECLRCNRVVEIQKVDAIRLYGPHAVYKDVGQRMLDNGCQQRTGRHEEDGCWPNWGWWTSTSRFR